jgi:hypothetical protein
MSLSKFRHPTITIETPAPGHYAIKGVQSPKQYIEGSGWVVAPDTCYVSPGVPDEALKAILADRKAAEFVAPSVEVQTKEEAMDDVKDEMKDKERNKLAGEAQEEVREEVKAEIRQEVASDVRKEVKQEIKQEATEHKGGKFFSKHRK